ncbi:unnamed protein product, partial [Nesidiocoris tenuis]
RETREQYSKNSKPTAPPSKLSFCRQYNFPSLHEQADVYSQMDDGDPRSPCIAESTIAGRSSKHAISISPIDGSQSLDTGDAITRSAGRPHCTSRPVASLAEPGGQLRLSTFPGNPGRPASRADAARREFLHAGNCLNC